MSYKILDEDRCLGFIKISNQNFFVYTFQDDFILDAKKYFIFPGVLEEVPIRSLLKKTNVDEFIKNNVSYIRSKEELLSDFLSLYSDPSADFWDIKDFGLLPHVVIDFDAKELFQLELEFTLIYSNYVPSDWKSYVTPGFLDSKKYYHRYPEIFYWVINGKDYLDYMLERTEQLVQPVDDLYD